MYSLYFGSDTTAVRSAAQKEIDVLIARGATLNRIDGDGYESGILADALGASSLFGGEELYVIDTPSAVSELETAVMESLVAMAESSNTFIIIENALLAAPKRKYEKHAAHSEEFKAQKVERFNTFALADALVGKDKRRLWLLLAEARQQGIAAEEIIGVLWWQLKSMRLAATTMSAQEAGMKDFPYNKAKRALVKFPKHEVIAKSASLLAVYHDGHLSRRDINDALEHWVLAL